MAYLEAIILKPQLKPQIAQKQEKTGRNANLR